MEASFRSTVTLGPGRLGNRGAGDPRPSVSKEPSILLHFRDPRVGSNVASIAGTACAGRMPPVHASLSLVSLSRPRGPTAGMRLGPLSDLRGVLHVVFGAPPLSKMEGGGHLLLLRASQRSSTSRPCHDSTFQELAHALAQLEQLASSTFQPATLVFRPQRQGTYSCALAIHLRPGDRISKHTTDTDTRPRAATHRHHVGSSAGRATAA
jgi:hypothetical protein